MGLIRPATPGFLVTLVATILLIVVSFSVPWFKSVFFLKAAVTQGNQSGFVTFGVLGYCTTINGGAQNCTKAQVGYKFDANTLLGDNIKFLQIPDVVTSWITWALVLHIVALACAAISAVFGLLAHIREFAMTCFSSCIAGVGAAVALIAFIFDLVLFFTARSRINSVQGGSAEIGSAIWLTLVAWVLLFLSGCFYTVGRCCVSGRPRGSKFNNKNNNNTNGFIPFNKNSATENGHDAYSEAMRLDAIKAEADRKARQAAPERGLPAFPTAEERRPLQTSTYEATYAEEEEDSPTSPYRDQARVGSPRSPRRAGSTATSNHAGAGAYGAAAVATGYTPGRQGNRTIDEYYNHANPEQPAYPPQTPSRASQNQNQNAYSDPYQQQPGTDHYYNQQPQVNYQQPQATQHRYGEYAAGAVGAAAVGAAGYAAYQHHEGQNQYPNGPRNNQYLNTGENYGHGYDNTTYHTATSHGQEPTQYEEQPTPYNPHDAQLRQPEPYTNQPTTNSNFLSVDGSSSYPSSNVLPSNRMPMPSTAQSPPEQLTASHNNSYYTPNLTNQDQHAQIRSPPPGLRPDSSATSYFPYSQQQQDQRQNQNQYLSTSPGGLHPVQEASHSSTGTRTNEPPSYTRGGESNYYPGGWPEKS